MGGGVSMHNDIYEERMLALLLESLTLINEIERGENKREGWHWLGMLDKEGGGVEGVVGLP